jgi:lipoyl(octanoyl) transferase
VQCLADAIVSVLAELGVAAEWRAETPGVWVGANKICAVGVHVRRRIAIHGFALNVGVDLANFDHIVPCGLRERGVISIERLLGIALDPSVLAERVARAFEVAFGIRLARIPASHARLQIANGNL